MHPVAAFLVAVCVVSGVSTLLAVLMVIGNAPVIPRGVTEPFATLTTTIVLDMSYASGDHRTALFGVAIVLFIVSMALVGAIRLVSRLGKQVG